jgi:uncharacterized protein (DUF1697 family)
MPIQQRPARAAARASGTAQVVFLRGVNVGGHRVFRPSTLPAQLPELGLVNIGAAGTFVVRRRTSQAALRRALARCLPFTAEIVVCTAAQIRALLASDIFAGQPAGPDVTRFVSVLSRPPEVLPLLPMEFRDGRRWLVKLVGMVDCFVAGVYRRHMKTIGYLGRIDSVFDAPVTTRNWNTFIRIVEVLEASSGHDSSTG